MFKKVAKEDSKKLIGLGMVKIHQVWDGKKDFRDPEYKRVRIAYVRYFIDIR